MKSTIPFLGNWLRIFFLSDFPDFLRVVGWFAESDPGENFVDFVSAGRQAGSSAAQLLKLLYQESEK